MVLLPPFSPSLLIAFDSIIRWTFTIHDGTFIIDAFSCLSRFDSIRLKLKCLLSALSSSSSSSNHDYNYRKNRMIY